MATRLFRWRAIGPLLVLGGIGLVLWAVFAEEIARQTSEEVGTSVLGAKVEIRRLDIDVRRANVTIAGLTVASPFDSLRNLLEADRLVADVDPLPLLEKKLVIDHLVATGLRFGTARATSGFAASHGRASGAELVRQEVTAWGERFNVPALQLAAGKVDVGRLDPARLATVREIEALAARADSIGRTWDAATRDLAVGPTVDSARALVQRLRGVRATDGRALADARRTLEELKRLRARVTTVERRLTGGAAALRGGVAALEHERQRDYAFARTLVRLPSLDAPDIAAALFAPVAIERFQRALYWAELGRRYMPPGLLPRADAGPARARRAGHTVRFPGARAYPAFLLRDAQISFLLDVDTGSAPREFAGRLTGLTSEPALYGRPMTLAASAPSVRIGALADHVRTTSRDTAGAVVEGVRLPAFPLPGLPFRLEPGRGTMGFQLALAGDALRARWTVRAGAVAWPRDTTRAGTIGGGEGNASIAGIVARVLAGVRELDLSAELGGTIRAPRLAIRSNLDRALSDGLRAVFGAEVAAAERRLRAEVDRVVEEKAAPVRARVQALEREATARVAAERQKVEQVQHDLEQRLREMTRNILIPGGE